MAKRKNAGQAEEVRLTYEQAYEELQRMVADMESETITVDELASKLQEAAKLLAICKRKLFDTEKDVKAILEQISGDE